ncbi:MAG TPA: hypothetical protein VFR76_05205 [Verrucomicrobiae bacterium]|nr:hypothetical protein [Verrucomicrobiae bacterium]
MTKALFNCIVPMRTVLLLGACALGTSLVGVCSAALAEKGLTDPPKPHWSHLPVWGVEAEIKGYQLPLPFGVGVNYYREQQPFNIKDLQVSRGGTPVSVNEFLQLKKVDTTQQNGIMRADAWLFPFFNVYGLVGYTSGKMQGNIILPAIPILGILAQDLPLNIGYEGPTYGGGGTLAGGFKVSEVGELTLFLVADANYTVTELSFTDERLFTDTNAKALVFSARLGLRCKMSEKLHLALWAGTMFQDVSESLVGRSVDKSFAFMVVEEPVAPWNALVGGRLEIGRHWDLMVEGGLGTRTSIMGGLTFRF